MLHKEDVKKFLADEIKVIGLLPEAVTSDHFDEDFLVSGLIDSFGFISLIMAVEAKFSIEIGEDLQLDDRLRTINGFSTLICEVMV
jgi:acyl carrier protein